MASIARWREDKFPVGFASDSKSVAAHASDLFRSVRSSVFARKNHKTTLPKKGEGEFLDANFEQPFDRPSQTFRLDDVRDSVRQEHC